MVYHNDDGKIKEFGSIPEKQTDVVNADGFSRSFETSSRIKESYVHTGQTFSSPLESNADTTSLPSQRKTKESSDNIKKVFSLKALAGSVVSVTAVTAVTVAAVLLSVVLNVTLFAATAFSLTFQLNINYQDDVLTAVLEGNDYRNEIVLSEGDEFVTFDGLTPETEYVFSIVRDNGEVLYSAAYRTESESNAYPCSLWIQGREGNDLLLFVEMYSEKFPPFYTVTVTTKGGKEIFAADRTPHTLQESEEWSSEESALRIPNYPFDETCYISVKAEGKGLALLTVYSPADYHFIENNVVLEPTTIKVLLQTDKMNEYFYATLGDQYVSLEQTDEFFTLFASGLEPATAYECVIYASTTSLPVFRATYTTAEGTPAEESALVLTESSFEEYDDGFYAFYTVENNPNEETFHATLNGETIDGDPDGDTYYYTTFGLDLFTPYTFTIYNDTTNDVLFTHEFTTRGVLVEEQFFEFGEYAISAEFTITNPYERTLTATLNGLDVGEIGEEFIYEELDPATEYSFIVYAHYDSGDDRVVYSTSFTSLGARIEETSFEYGETSLVAEFAIVNPNELSFYGELNGVTTDYAGETSFVLDDLSPATDYNFTIRNAENDDVLYSRSFTTHGSIVAIVSEDFTFNSIDLVLKIYNPYEEELTFFMNDTPETLPETSDGFLWQHQNLDAGTTYTFRVENENGVVFGRQYTTDHMLSLEYDEDLSMYVARPTTSFLAYVTEYNDDYEFTFTDEMGNILMSEGSDQSYHELDEHFFSYAGTYSLMTELTDSGAIENTEFTIDGKERPTFSTEYDAGENSLTVTILTGNRMLLGTTNVVFAELDNPEANYALSFNLSESSENYVTISLNSTAFSRTPGTYSVRIIEDMDYYTLATTEFTVEE